MLPRSSSVLLLLLAACGETTIFTGLPDAEGVRSFVIADGLPSARTIIATSVSEIEARTVRLETEDARVEAWSYVESLEELALAQGTLREEPGAPGLPEPAARWTYDFSSEAWIPDENPRLLPGVEVVHTTKCTSFEVEAVPLGIGRTFMMSLLPDGRLLHGFSDDNTGETTLRAIDANGTIEILAISPAQFGTAGVVIEDSLWIATFLGDVFQSPLSDLSTFTSSLAIAGREWQGIAGGRIEGGTELYVFSNTGELVRVQPDGIEVLEPAQSLGKSTASILWVGPGEVYAASPVRRTVLHLVDGVVLHEELPLAGGSPLEVEASTRRTLLAGASSAEIYARDGDRWSHLATYPLMIGVSGLLELPEGLLVGGDSELREWREPESMFCPPIPAPKGIVYTQLARVGSVLVASGRPNVRARAGSLALLRPRS